MKNSKVYKIRRKMDGLFSTGGTSPSFTEKGKLWTTMSGLKNHLNLLGNNLNACYGECEVITIEVIHKVIKTQSMTEMTEERIRLNAEKKRRIQEASAREKDERDRAELARLKAIYEKE